MSIQIKNHAGEVLHTVDADTLRGADLSNLNLVGAKLPATDLSGANLIRTDMRYADMRYANLARTKLWGTDFRFSDLTDVNFAGADYTAPWREPQASMEPAQASEETETPVP